MITVDPPTFSKPIVICRNHEINAVLVLKLFQIVGPAFKGQIKSFPGRRSGPAGWLVWAHDSRLRLDPESASRTPTTMDRPNISVGSEHRETLSDVMLTQSSLATVQPGFLTYQRDNPFGLGGQKTRPPGLWSSRTGFQNRCCTVAD